VEVKGKSYEVRARRGYRVGMDAPATEQQRTGLLRDALWSPMPAAGITLAVRAEKVEDPQPGSLRLTLAVDAASLTFQPKDGKWSGALDYLVAQRAGDGHFVNRVLKALAWNADQEQYRRMLAEGVTISITIRPAADAAQVRVVLLDRTSGRVGSVIVPLAK
jgi:hypothetical protein